MGSENLELPVAANRAQLVTYPPTVPNCKLYVHDHLWGRPTDTEFSLRVARAVFPKKIDSDKLLQFSCGEPRGMCHFKRVAPVPRGARHLHLYKRDLLCSENHPNPPSIKEEGDSELLPGISRPI
jgi:hypothetical protein